MPPSEALVHVPFVLAIENETHRLQMVDIFAELGYQPEQVGSASLIYHLTREQFANSWVILDTNDDIAWLVQAVNDYHRSPFHIGGGAPIFCIASSSAIEVNPRLAFWLIDGGAAVSGVGGREPEYDFRPWLNRIIKQTSRFPKEEPTPPRSDYDALITQMLQNPRDWKVLLELGVRLCDWDNSHQIRYEVGRAFLRHTVLLMPNSPQAHLHYGKSFRIAQWQEALFHLREAVRLAPDWAEAYYTLGQFLADRDKSEARKALLKAIELDRQGTFGKMAQSIIVSRDLA